MFSFILIGLSVIMSITTFGLAVPTTYNQRQDGGLNVAAKLENIMVLIALPSSSSSGPKLNTAENNELASYLTLFNADQTPPHSSPTHLYDAESINNDRKNEPSKIIENDDDEVVVDDAIAFPDDDDDDSKVLDMKELKKPVKISSRGRPKSRTLWSQVDDVVDNRQGTSLKKELSWGQDEDADAVAPVQGDVDDQARRSNEHNEVGLIPTRHLTLVGTAVEDCGPDRRRNSYGICQAQPSE